MREALSRAPGAPLERGTSTLLVGRTLVLSVQAVEVEVSVQVWVSLGARGRPASQVVLQSWWTLPVDSTSVRVEL